MPPPIKSVATAGFAGYFSVRFCLLMFVVVSGCLFLGGACAKLYYLGVKCVLCCHAAASSARVCSAPEAMKRVLTAMMILLGVVCEPGIDYYEYEHDYDGKVSGFARWPRKWPRQRWPRTCPRKRCRASRSEDYELPTPSPEAVDYDPTPSPEIYDDYDLLRALTPSPETASSSSSSGASSSASSPTSSQFTFTCGVVVGLSSASLFREARKRCCRRTFVFNRKASTAQKGRDAVNTWKR